MYELAALESDFAGTIYEGKLHFAPATGSTNTDAMTAARAGAPHGSVFFADEQWAGRGRGNHAWHSAAGRRSVRERCGAAGDARRYLPLLPLVAGLAAADAIRDASGLAVDLRWPNDLLLGPRKTGGILVEAQSNRARSLSRWWASASTFIKGLLIPDWRPRRRRSICSLGAASRQPYCSPC